MAGLRVSVMRTRLVTVTALLPTLSSTSYVNLNCAPLGALESKRAGVASTATVLLPLLKAPRTDVERALPYPPPGRVATPSHAA